MNSGYYRFRILEVPVHRPRRRQLQLPAGELLLECSQARTGGGTPPEGLPIDHVSTPYTCLVLDAGAHRVIIDAGPGPLGEHASAFFPSIDHSTTATCM